MKNVFNAVIALGERVEALLRIPLAFVYAIIISVLEMAVGIVLIIQFFYTLILGRRHEGMVCFTNKYASPNYHINRYLQFPSLSQRIGLLLEFSGV